MSIFSFIESNTASAAVYSSVSAFTRLQSTLPHGGIDSPNGFNLWPICGQAQLHML